MDLHATFIDAAVAAGVQHIVYIPFTAAAPDAEFPVARADVASASYRAPQWQLDARVSTYTAIASNAMAKVSAHIEIITGSAPMPFQDYLRR